MDNQSEYIEDIRIIKKVMEESSRFLSLSGLSGLFAGLIALAGAAFAIFILFDGRFLLDHRSSAAIPHGNEAYRYRTE